MAAFRLTLFCAVLAAMAGNFAHAQTPGPSAANRAMQAATMDFDAPLVPSFDIQRFVVEGNSLLDAGRIESLVAPFIGTGRTFGDVQGAIEALEEAYRTQGYGSVGVLLPEQMLESGIVRLRVVEARIRRVEVTGNQHFDTANIRASIPMLVEGGVPNLDAISASLRVANENPAKNITLQLSPGSGDDDLQATIKANDQRAWKVGLNYDNSGTDQTGDDRVGFSAQHGNLWNRDHVLTLQYQTSPRNSGDVQVAALTYRVPLYGWGDVVDFYASKSDIDAGTIAAGPFNLAITGKGESYGARYAFKLKRRGDVDHELVLGLDHKRFQNGIGFGSTDLGNEVVTHPFTLQYNNKTSRTGEELMWNVNLVRNIAGGSLGDQAAITSVRQGAEADYVVLRGGLTYSRAFSDDWQGRLALAAQLADAPLISSEQFGAGGASSVRGFNEREVSNDRGFQGALELYSPELCANRWAGQQCRTLAFFDWASLARIDPQPGEIERENIASAGLGLRWSLGSSATLQFDYARVLEEGGLSRRGDWKLHARLGLFF